MKDADSRREHPRVPVFLHVHFKHGDKPYRLASENLSLGGIFLQGAHTICKAGDALTLELVVAGADGKEERHAIDSVVVHTMDGVGAGLRFVWNERSLAHRPALEAFIVRAGMLNDAVMHDESIGLSTDAEELPH